MALRLVRNSCWRSRGRRLLLIPDRHLRQQLGPVKSLFGHSGLLFGAIKDPTFCTAAFPSSLSIPCRQECVPVKNIFDLDGEDSSDEDSPDEDSPDDLRMVPNADTDDYLRMVPNADTDDRIIDIAKFALEEINLKQASDLKFVKVLGAWIRPVFCRKYDITLEATDGDGIRKFYRVGVCVVAIHEIVDLVQWVPIEHPHPISYFEPETYQGYGKRLGILYEKSHWSPKMSDHQKNVLRWFKLDEFRHWKKWSI